MKSKIVEYFRFTKQVISEFITDNSLKYSASLAYYTVFSLAPMLIIIISVFNFLLGDQVVEGRIYDQINDLVGTDAALQVQDTIRNMKLHKESTFVQIVSIVALLIGATGVFGEIQDSLNKIWGLKLKERTKVWWKMILNRILSFSLIISLGFVLVVSLILNAVIAGIGSYLENLITGAGKTIIPTVNVLLSIIINMLLFSTIFKILPDAKIKWKDVLVGSLITSILFTIGKWVIGYYLGSSDMANMYGAAGSVIIILVWTYYSAAILYLGASFTKVYARQYGGKIRPNEYSTWIIVEEVPVKHQVLNSEVPNVPPEIKKPG